MRHGSYLLLSRGALKLNVPLQYEAQKGRKQQSHRWVALLWRLVAYDLLYFGVVHMPNVSTTDLIDELFGKITGVVADPFQ